MSKFNTQNTTSLVQGPITSSPVADTQTFNRAPGFSRDAKSELFLLGVSNLVGEKTYYESASTRDNRFNALVAEVAVTDPLWLTQFAGWLRSEANMRSAPVVLAAQAVKARLNAGLHGGNRQIVDAVLQRPDEPGELIAYWQGEFGRKIPKPVKRGIGDAANRLFNQWSILKYDTDSHGVRFADVIALTHPTPTAPFAADVFKHAMDRRYDRDDEVPESLWVIRNRKAFMALSNDERREIVNRGDFETIKNAGITWEALSGIITGGMDARAWEVMIPSMGYMALLRNLRNFEQAGVSKETLKSVADRISNPDEVAKSKQFPFRFYNAYQATKNSLRFGSALEDALNASVKNVPALKGRTLILVDQSPSMWWEKLSQHSDLTWAEGATVFGAALALRAENATLVGFGEVSSEIKFSKSDSILPLIGKFRQFSGTNIQRAIDAHYNGHDRVVVITDEQTSPHFNSWAGRVGEFGTNLPARVPLYTWNLVGYAAGWTPTKKNSFTLGGLSDVAFKLIPLLERAVDAPWPWMVSND